MCRTVEEITEKDLIVQELDERIKESGGLIVSMETIQLMENGQV